MMNQTTKGIILAVLILVAGGVFFFDANGVQFPGKKSSSWTSKPYDPLPVENPALQRWKLDATRHTEYKSTGRDLFSESLPPAPRRPAPIVRAPDPGPQPPVEPPPPTLGNVKYFGYGTVPNGASKRGFLTDSEEVYIVAEGDTFLGRFRILRIGNTSLEFEEISSGRRNSAPLDEQAAPAQ
jgi:hypothetical protein